MGEAAPVTINGQGPRVYGSISNQHSNMRERVNAPQSGTVPPAYEEFFGGTVACPTCNGAGRIPREKENELVALIPMNDKRLKPRRTKRYVGIAITIAALIAGLLMFFLFPRTIQLRSNDPNLQPTYLYINKTESLVFMTVVNSYNISNENFFEVEVSTLAVSVLFDQRILASQNNKTVVKIPLRSVRLHAVTLNITFSGDEGYIAGFCGAPARYAHTLLMPFQATATISYLGRTEESTLTTYQHVRCSEEGQ